MHECTNSSVIRQHSTASCQWPGCQQPGDTALVLSRYQLLCRAHARAEQHSTLANDIQVDFLRTMTKVKKSQGQS